MLRRYFAIAGIVVCAASIVSGAPHVIRQKGRLFSPRTLTVKAGDVLQFQNDDDVTHHIYSSTKGQEFDLDTMEPGGKKERAFAKPGRVDIRCGLHPGMRLVATVE